MISAGAAFEAESRRRASARTDRPQSGKPGASYREWRKSAIGSMKGNRLIRQYLPAAAIARSGVDVAIMSSFILRG
jgi:hypothetical protein